MTRPSTSTVDPRRSFLYRGNGQLIRRARARDLGPTSPAVCNAGDAAIGRRTGELARAPRRQASARIPDIARDPPGFGRRRTRIEIFRNRKPGRPYQIGALQAIATAARPQVTLSRRNGALSNSALRGQHYRQAIASRDQVSNPQSLSSCARQSKLVLAGENGINLRPGRVFADRAYEDDGNLGLAQKPGRCARSQGNSPIACTLEWQDGAGGSR